MAHLQFLSEDHREKTSFVDIQNLKQEIMSHCYTIQEYPYIGLFSLYSLRPSQQFFSYVRAGLPGFNQY